LDKYWGVGPPLLFFGSERVWTVAASEQPTGHSGLTSKAEEEGFKVSPQPKNRSRAYQLVKWILAFSD